MNNKPYIEITEEMYDYLNMCISDMLRPIENVRNQLITAREELKRLYFSSSDTEKTQP